jgi:hypothetical protein
VAAVGAVVRFSLAVECMRQALLASKQHMLSCQMSASSLMLHMHAPHYTLELVV